MEALGLRLAIRGLSALDLRSCSASEMEEEEDDRDETLLTLMLLSFAGGMAGTGAVPSVALVKLAMLQRPCSPIKKKTPLSFLFFPLLFFFFWPSVPLFSFLF